MSDAAAGAVPHSAATPGPDAAAVPPGSGDALSAATPSWLSAVLAASDDAVVGVDLEGVVRSWNPGAVRRFGYAAADIIGQPVAILVPGDRRAEAEEILALVRRGGTPDPRETRRLHRDGRPLAVALSVSPVRDAAGGVVGAIRIWRDPSDRGRADAATRRFAAIVESSDDAIISKDLHGVIQSWNGGAERLFGYTAAEAVGQPVLMLIPPDRQDEEPAILARLARGERIEHYETVRRCRDGSLVEVSLSVSPILGADGTVVGAAKIARDITARKQAQRALEEAHARTLEANRTKDVFLAALSHELRTPLNPALLVASGRAADAALPAELRADFDLIRKGLELEARLIDDLLDLARVTPLRLRLNLTRVDLRDVLRDAIATTQGELQQKGQQVAVAGPGAPVLVAGDAVRLQQVIWNVLRNAVKFTPPGGRIAADLRTAAGTAVLEITDAGAGIAPADLERIFDPFGPAARDAEAAGEISGFGFGLAIARRILELHRGRISAASPGPGLGSRLTIELPLAPAIPAAAAAAAPARPPTPPRRILLVEDHPPSLRSLGALLVRRGCEVVGVPTAREALARAAEERFSLVISDIGLPDMNGFDLIGELKRSFDLPAIVLTGFGSESDTVRSRAAGAVAHLTKPVNLQALEAALLQALPAAPPNPAAS